MPGREAVSAKALGQVHVCVFGAMYGTHPMRVVLEGHLGSQCSWSWLELLEQVGKWVERGQRSDGEGRLIVQSPQATVGTHALE